MVHGWPWNRLGEAATDILSSLNGSTPVDLLRMAHALHTDGYHVLMFDLRNHGESGSAPPVTFGWQEMKDLLGALAYVNGRSEVDPNRIAAIGFSMGANTVLYTLPQTRQIQAAVAVQPTSVAVFADRFATDMLGVLGKVVLPLTEVMYQMAGGLPFADLRPSAAASGAGETPVLYVQGSGDKWGSMADVSQIAAVTPRPSGPLFPDTTHRYEGYQYVVDNPKIVLAFFEQHLPE
jgi:alpha-beta hydrolase superfamily lysophospholipase